MRPLRTLATTAVIALALVARPAHAQISLGLGGGYTSPNGDMQDIQKQGWNVLGTLQVGVPLMPISLRGDVQYNSFGGKDTDIPPFLPGTSTVRSEDARVLSATVNLVWNIVPLGPVKPYVIGGAGYYTTEVNLNDPGRNFSADTRKFGYNYGAGVKVGLLGIAGFVEARIHSVPKGIANDASVRYIPITAGIFF